MGISPGSRANNMYSPGCEKLTEVQLYMSVSCQPGSQVIRPSLTLKNLFLFSDLEVKAAKLENEKVFFSKLEKTRINNRVNKFY